MLIRQDSLLLVFSCPNLLPRFLELITRGDGTPLLSMSQLEKSEPIDRRFVVRDEILVRFTKMFTAEETRGGGKGRRMWRFENEMFASVDVRTFRFRIIAPEHKNEMLAIEGQGANGGVGK